MDWQVGDEIIPFLENPILPTKRKEWPFSLMVIFGTVALNASVRQNQMSTIGVGKLNAIEDGT